MAGEGFDPATGTVRRQVTDLVVPGSVGAFPLAFTRMLNSRLPLVSLPLADPASFGKAGTWRHSYEWSIDPFDVSGQYGLPPSYTVYYPDGRRLTFGSSNSFRGPAGIPDYFTPLPPGAGNEGEVHLFLPDGSRVDFAATRDVEEVGQGVYVSHFTYRCFAIVDPYGRSIFLSDDGTALTVSEPSGPGGGRSLHIVYRTIGSSAEGRVGDRVVSYVQEYLTPQQPGRRVDYDYASFPLNSGQFTSLVGVRYFGDSSLSATYTYQNNNYQGSCLD